MHDSLPIGLFISGWILNIILKHMDQRIRDHKGCRFYIRYMDDICVLGPNKRHLRQILDNIIVPELTRLELELKPNWVINRIDKKNPKSTDMFVDMLGYRVYRDNTLLRRKNFLKLKQLSHKILITKEKEGQMTEKQARSLLSLASPLKNVYRKPIVDKYLNKGELLEEAKDIISRNKTIENIKAKDPNWEPTSEEDIPISKNRKRKKKKEKQRKEQLKAKEDKAERLKNKKKNLSLLKDDYPMIKNLPRFGLMSEIGLATLNPREYNDYLAATQDSRVPIPIGVRPNHVYYNKSILYR